MLTGLKMCEKHQLGYVPTAQASEEMVAVAGEAFAVHGVRFGN